MNIDLSLVPTMWYEDKDGNRYVPTREETEHLVDPPPGYIYFHSQFPNSLRLTVLRAVLPSEVAACEHPRDDVRRTYGWIDGVEGRECSICKGSQTRNVDEPWPDEWDANGTREVACGESTWSEDLVLAMASHHWWRFRKVYTLGEAILIVANCCEQCLNVLGHEYGMKWGYAEGSEEWWKCGTSCQFCSSKRTSKEPKQ